MRQLRESLLVARVILIASNSTIATSKRPGVETLKDCCQQLQRVWAEAKCTRRRWGGAGDWTCGHCQGKMEAQTVDAMVDTRSVTTWWVQDNYCKGEITGECMPSLTLMSQFMTTGQRLIPIGAKGWILSALKFSWGFYFVIIIVKKLAALNFRGFNVGEYIVCLVLRPSQTNFSRMWTNSRSTQN